MKVRASEQAIRKAREALIPKGWKQTKLLEEAKSRNHKLSSQQLSNFFQNKAVERSTADKIGFLLGLTWEDGDLEPALGKRKQDNGTDIDELVREVRSLYRSKIQYDCDKIQFLNRQVPIDDLYTKVYILEDIPKLRSLDISQRMQGFDPTADDPNSFYLGKVRSERILGLDVVTDGCKLMCLGAPGSGKTTYLSYVAIQCNKENLQANRVPIFIRLFSFAEKVAEKLTEQPQWSLSGYIEDLLGIQGIQQGDVKSILFEGRGLILLDGLDEVPKNIEKLNIFYDLPKNFDLSKLILRRIREFCETYHKNSIIITCRTNALDYNFSNLGFTQVIVSDFEDEQIKIFAEKWFVAAAKNNKQVGKAKTKQFIEKLELSKNKRIRDLAVTPILLNLTCLVFNKNDDFPSNRYELYRQALDILLKEWDTSREIPRDEVYGNLDLDGKKALLTHVAKVTFEENRYFFKQEEIKKYIADYLQTLPNAQTCRLQPDSEAVLKSLEAQHGLFIERADEIYSFSHLTFQEYFAAKWFCEPSQWEDLVRHITEKSWREVFLLTAMIGKYTDKMLQLMQQIIENLVLDEQLQELLHLIKQKSDSFEGLAKKIAAIRAVALSQNLAIIKNHIFDKNDNSNSLCLKSNSNNISDDNKSSNSIDNHSIITITAVIRLVGSVTSYDLDLAQAIEPEIVQKLQQLVNLSIQQHDVFFRQFSNEQKELLQQYYDANKLLVDCLNSDCKVSKAVKEEIEKRLLLPIDEIKKRQ